MQYIKKIILALFSVFIFLALQGNSVDAAEVYSWVDAKGVKHYSDRPVKSAKKQKIRVSSPGKQASEETEPVVLNESEQAKRNADCKAARSNVTNLLKGGRITEKDDEGKSVVLTTTQMNDKLSLYQDFIKRNCKQVEASES